MRKRILGIILTVCLAVGTAVPPVEAAEPVLEKVQEGRNSAALTVNTENPNLDDLGSSSVTTINFAEGLEYITICGSKTVVNGTAMSTIPTKAGKTLTTVNLPKSVKSFAAYDCPNLSKLNCPKHFSQIDISLRGCPKLHIEVWVKGAVMKDFSNTGITKLTIDPSGWGKWGWLKGGLNNCPNLKEIVLAKKSNYYFVKNGMLCWKNKKSSKTYDILAYPAGRSTSGNFTIPKDAKCVYHGAFDSCKFKTITIPENITDDWYWENYSEDGKADSMLRGNKAVLCLVRDSAADTDAESLNVAQKRVRRKYGSTYRISYKLKGGKNAPGNPVSYRAGQIKKLKKPTRKGYKFLGWKRSVGGKKSGWTWETYCNTTERQTGPFANYTFTACWKKTGAGNPGTDKKKPHKITVNKSYHKTLASKPFSLKAKSSTGAKLSYKSGNTKVAKVDAKGKVKIVGVGKAVITIAAKAGKKYAAKKVKVTVVVKK